MRLHSAPLRSEGGSHWLAHSSAFMFVHEDLLFSSVSFILIPFSDSDREDAVRRNKTQDGLTDDCGRAETGTPMFLSSHPERNE